MTDLKAEKQRMPGGIPFIVGNEAAERFSYYGMRAILVIFMTQHLRNAAGELDLMSDTEARGWYHAFSSAVYFFPMLGAVLSDGFLGKYRTVIFLSIAYCLGHFALALDDTRLGLQVGLGLIALGSGGIKPCVAANLGDQFSERNSSLMSKAFGWFYFSVNFGAFVSTIVTPLLLQRYGPDVAFGLPGILMLLATIVFWLGRHRYVRVPPGGPAFLREAVGREGLRAMGKLVMLYGFFAVFWSIYDQNGSTWVLQATHMDRQFLGREWLPSQIQVLNPILVMIYIPLFSYVLYPAIHRVFPLTPIRKIGMGFFCTVPCVLVIAWVEHQIQLGETPNIGWHVIAFMILIAAEVMVYQTGLELSYTQAPNRMKSLIMAFYNLSISLGNAFTSGLNFFIQNDDGSTRLGAVEYHLFFAGLMLVTAIVFVFVSRFFVTKTYLQETPSP